eukprot:6842607-Karenia_brevis.AAC.1
MLVMTVSHDMRRWRRPLPRLTLASRDGCVGADYMASNHTSTPTGREPSWLSSALLSSREL